MSYFLHAAPLKDFRLRCHSHKEIFIQTDFSRRMKIIFGHFASQNSADLIDRPSICATYFRSTVHAAYLRSTLFFDHFTSMITISDSQ